MSGMSREATRETYWRAAGALLGEQRTRLGWTRPELAERAGLQPDPAAAYEQGLVLDPGLEDWWRLTIALGIGLEPTLQVAEREAGARLVRDVPAPGQAPQSGGLRPREQTGGLGARIQARQSGELPPPQESAPAGDADQLGGLLARLREKHGGA